MLQIYFTHCHLLDNFIKHVGFFLKYQKEHISEVPVLGYLVP